MENKSLYFFTNHKSGASFIQKALGRFAGANRFNFYSTPYSFGDFKRDKDIFLFNNDNKLDVYLYRNTEYGAIDKYSINSGIFIVRNPLSVIKSAYYSHLNTHKLSDWTQLSEQREKLRLASFDDGIRLTVKFLEEEDFFKGQRGPLRSIELWEFDDLRFKIFRMEDITLAPVSFLLDAFETTGLNRSDLVFPSYEVFDFEHHSGGRKLGDIDETSHLRSGDPDEWRSKLPVDVIEYVREKYRLLLSRYYPESLFDNPGTTNIEKMHKANLVRREVVEREYLDVLQLTKLREARIKLLETVRDDKIQLGKAYNILLGQYNKIKTTTDVKMSE